MVMVEAFTLGRQDGKIMCTLNCNLVHDLAQPKKKMIRFDRAWLSKRDYIHFHVNGFSARFF